MKKAAIALIVLSALRVASTWTIYSATVDEPMHVSAGLEIYTQHAYTYQQENPPLPRLVLALAPYLGGMEFDPKRTIADQLLRVFYSHGRYKTNLVLARAGNLVFFVLASIAVWLWAERLLGEKAALIATALFTLQPMIAGHAGLATHDLPAAAGVAWSLYAFACWLDEQTTKRAALFGIAFGAAVLCKFSCIGYVPAACLAMYLVRRDFRWRALLPSFFAALIATLLVICAGYGFHVSLFVEGIQKLAVLAKGGHFVFLFGDVGIKGWWWYFPVAIALKSTIASLILALFARGRGYEALAAVIAILLVSMTSHLNLGVRYVLPLYAPLAVAGASVSLRRWLLAPLLAWHCVASAIAIPDAFPYFNEAAGPRPWQYLLDSNIDWGQDVLRLRGVVREKKIDRIGLMILGWHDWDALRFPPHYALQRDVPSQGWVAVSEHLLGLANGAPWLQGRPYERVGKSIRLYYVK